MHLDWRFDNPFTREFTVSAGYIDALGHTNNTIYSQWCEETAWAHSAALGMDAAGYQRLDRAMAIQRAEYDYLLPSFAGETLLVGTWLTAMQRKLTMERCFQIFNRQTGSLLLQGKWQLVCIRIGTGKPVKMPTEFIQAYAPHIISAG